MITLSDPINAAIYPQSFYFNASTTASSVTVQIALNAAAIVGDNIIQATVTSLNGGVDGGILVQAFPLTITLLPCNATAAPPLLSRDTFNIIYVLIYIYSGCHP